MYLIHCIKIGFSNSANSIQCTHELGLKLFQENQNSNRNIYLYKISLAIFFLLSRVCSKTNKMLFDRKEIQIMQTCLKVS